MTTVLANVKTPHLVQRDCTKAGISVLLEKSAFDWKFSKLPMGGDSGAVCHMVSLPQVSTAVTSFKRA